MLFSKKNRTSKLQSGKKSHHRKKVLSMESLESRQLMAVDFSNAIEIPLSDKYR